MEDSHVINYLQKHKDIDVDVNDEDGCINYPAPSSKVFAFLSFNSLFFLFRKFSIFPFQFFAMFVNLES